MCFTPMCTIRLLYFVWFGATTCLLPFLPLHMKALGIPLWHSTVLSGTIPLFQLMTCTIASFVPQCSPSYKKSILWSLLFTAIAALLIVFTPRVPKPTEKHIALTFQCGSAIEPRILVDKCNHQCDDNPSLSSLGIEVFFTECHVDCPGMSGDFMNNADLCFDQGPARICHVVEINNTLSENFTFVLHLDKGYTNEVDENKCIQPVRGVTWQEKGYERVSCPIIMTQKTNLQCVLNCRLEEVFSQLAGWRVCLPNAPSAVNYAIWMYVGLRLIFHICQGVSSTITERALVYYIKKEGRNVKHYSIWSHLSSYIIAPLAGLLIDNPRSEDIMFNYKLLIGLFFVLVLITMVLISSIEVENTTFPPIKDTLKVLPSLLVKCDAILLLIVALLLGAVSGFLDTFLFWHLEDQSCPRYVMGLTVTVGLFFSFPLLCAQLPRSLIKRISHGYMLSTCLMFQCLRCLGYYISENFWWCLLFESFGNIAFLITWSIISDYICVFIAQENKVHGHSFIGAWHYGLGKSCGIFIGGSVMVLYGFRVAFLAFALALGLASSFYAILYYSVFPKNPENRKIQTDTAESEAEDEKQVSLLQPICMTPSPDDTVASVEVKILGNTDETAV